VGVRVEFAPLYNLASSSNSVFHGACTLSYSQTHPEYCPHRLLAAKGGEVVSGVAAAPDLHLVAIGVLPAPATGDGSLAVGLQMSSVPSKAIMPCSLSGEATC